MWSVGRDCYLRGIQDKVQGREPDEGKSRRGVGRTRPSQPVKPKVPYLTLGLTLVVTCL